MKPEQILLNEAETEWDIISLIKLEFSGNENENSNYVDT